MVIIAARTTRPLRCAPIMPTLPAPGMGACLPAPFKGATQTIRCFYCRLYRLFSLLSITYNGRGPFADTGRVAHPKGYNDAGLKKDR